MNANKYANAAQQPSLEQLLRAEITALREQVAELKAMVVMRCDLDTPPQFSQGFQPHEVLEPVTAEHCQWFVAKIEKLTKERETRLDLAEQNKQLKAELKSIDGALDDPRANLTLTTSEIILELKEQVDVLTEAYDQCGRTVQDYGRTIDQTESRLREVAAHCANVEEQLAALAEQNEKLTKERDELKTVPMKYRRMQFNAELQDEVTQLQKQLAALAEQNKKLRKAIVLACAAIDEGVIDHEWNFGIIREAKYLPDLASPVLNSIPKEPTLPVFDADSPRFRQVFDEAVQAHNLPGKRKGEGYRSPITQWCFEIAYSVVNRLRLYEK